MASTRLDEALGASTRCAREPRHNAGCSKILEKGVTTTVQSKRGYEQLMDSFVGTKVYAAPEILRHKPYDATVDEYSTGVLVALLLTGKHPLSDIEVDTNLALASCDVPF